MFGIPTEVFPFIFAVLAAVSGYVESRRGPADEIASKILYVVAGGCVLIGLWVILSQR